MITNQLNLILSNEEVSRLTIKDNASYIPQIIADVHGMKCAQAKRFINNIINAIRTTFKLVIIHGYNHGTAIKDMLSNEFTNSHITEKHLDPHNQGVTHIKIA